MMRWIRKKSDIIDFSRLSSKIQKYDYTKLMKYYDRQKKSVLNSLITVKEYVNDILDKKSLDFEDYGVPNAFNEVFGAIRVIDTSYPCCSTNVLYVEKRRNKYLNGDKIIKWEYGIIQDDFYLKIITEENIEWMVEYSYHI